MKKHIRKLHRWIGVLASLWLLVLASTGLLLQHSKDWGLEKKHITNSSLLKAYGIGKKYKAFKHGDQLLQQVDKQLIQNQKITIKLSENITAAIYQSPNWVITTKSQILWINQVGQIAQSMDEIDGLPLPLLDLGLTGNQLIIKTNDGNFLLNTLEKINTMPVNWSHETEDEKLKHNSIQQISHNYVSYQQAIFDLHAGITTPSLLNDIAAIALILLSLSGVFLFFRKNKRSNHQHN